MTNFTERFVKSVAKADGKRKKLYTDDRTKGLVLEVRDTGGKTYYLRHSDDRNGQKLHKLARAEDITVADARKLADQLRRQLIMGEDPKALKAAKKAVPTFAEFTREQYIPDIKTYKKSTETDISILNNHLLPTLGRKRMDEITRGDINNILLKRWDNGGKAASVNRTLILVRFMFNQAIRWKVLGITDNPASGIAMRPVNNQIERYLTDAETAALYATVSKSRNKMLKNIIAGLILTGARKSELLNVEWSEIDFEKRSWRIPDSKGSEQASMPYENGSSINRKKP